MAPSQKPQPARLVIGISGASGVVFGVRLLELLRGTMIETRHGRGDRHVAQKGRGIFLVYVDIDAEHDQEVQVVPDQDVVDDQLVVVRRNHREELQHQ